MSSFPGSFIIFPVVASPTAVIARLDRAIQH
jgi:hypothetical protein